MSFDDEIRANLDKYKDLLDKVSVITSNKENDNEKDYSAFLSNIDLLYLKKLKEKSNKFDTNKLAEALFKTNLGSAIIENIYIIDKYIFVKKLYPNGSIIIEPVDDCINDSFITKDDIITNLNSAFYFKGNSNMNFTSEFKYKVNNSLLGNINEVLDKDDLGNISFFNGRIYYDNRNINVYITKSFYEICNIIKDRQTEKIDLIISYDDDINLYYINISDGKIEIIPSNKETICLFEKEKTKSRDSKTYKIGRFFNTDE